jgi:hypothetical protein
LIVPPCPYRVSDLHQRNSSSNSSNSSNNSNSNISNNTPNRPSPTSERRRRPPGERPITPRPRCRTARCTRQRTHRPRAIRRAATEWSTASPRRSTCSLLRWTNAGFPGVYFLHDGVGRVGMSKMMLGGQDSPPTDTIGDHNTLRPPTTYSIHGVTLLFSHQASSLHNGSLHAVASASDICIR